MPRQHLARLLYCYYLYSLSREVFGDVFVMGVRWGFEMIAFNNIKAMLDPYAYDKAIVGFDTFEGFSSIGEKDGTNEVIADGAYGVTEEYSGTLSKIIRAHQDNAPRSHLTRCEIVKGDIVNTLNQYLAEKPQTIVSLLYIDLDLYEPTKKSIELLYDRIPAGGILCFDQLNHKIFQGETRAFIESLGLSSSRVKKMSWLPGRGYIIKGD